MLLTDVKEGFRVVVIEDQVVLPNKDLRRIRLAVGDEVTFECIASAQNYSSDIKWYFNKKPVEEYDGKTTPQADVTKLIVFFPLFQHLHLKLVKRNFQRNVTSQLLTWVENTRAYTNAQRKDYLRMLSMPAKLMWKLLVSVKI